jgi:hypothetical protein
VSVDSCNSAPPRPGGPLAWTRVYLPRGHKAHLKEVLSCPVNQDHGDEDFIGTGSQDEYDRAARMPLCLWCWRVQGHYANHPDERLGSGHGVEMT